MASNRRNPVQPSDFPPESWRPDAAARPRDNPLVPCSQDDNFRANVIEGIRNTLERFGRGQDRRLIALLDDLRRDWHPPKVFTGDPTLDRVEGQRDVADAKQANAASLAPHLDREIDRYLSDSPMAGLMSLDEALAKLLAETAVAWTQETCAPPNVQQGRREEPACTSLGPTLADARAPAELAPVDAALSDLQDSLDAFRDSMRTTLKERLRELILSLPQGHFGSLDRNSAFVVDLNRLLDQGNWTLVAPNGKAVRLQIVNPGGSTTGYFALRHPDSTKYRVPKGIDTTSLASLLASIEVSSKLTRRESGSP
jgi:hypothetical protein